MSSSKARLLRNVPLLARLTDIELGKLAGVLNLLTFKDKSNIIRQGEEGKGFFIIKKGTVEVVQRERVGDPSTSSDLATLRAGDYFGETALLTEGKRSATITAVGDVECFYLARKAFQDLFGKTRAVKFVKRGAISSDVHQTGHQRVCVPKGASKEKDRCTRRLILNAVRFNVLFMNLDLAHQHMVVDEMYRITVAKGTDIITQGDLGDNLYVVHSGTFHVFVKGVGMVAKRSNGTCFGELALMYGSPRAATVTAMEDSIVWVVDRYTFRRVVTGLTKNKFNEHVQFLTKVDLLSPLANYEREKIAEALEEVVFEENQWVVKQGEEGDCIYLVAQGELSITKSEGGGEAVEVMRCHKGDYFGERALIRNEPRAASIQAVKRCVLLRLDRSAFSLLLGPLSEIMEKKINEDYDVSYKPTLTRKPSNSSRIKEGTTNRNNIKIDNLLHLGTLGQGSFGYVTLVRDKTSGKTYALKAVNKAQIVQTGQQGHIMSEKRCMAKMDHPFLVKLWATFKTRDRLYFLLEPSLGGELFSLLREKTMFDEETARFYSGSVVLAFEYMHNKDFVYRDLKPENLLLDSKGSLKITDFGFAKDISPGRTWTLCGTPDYLAPEVVAGKGHGKGVDWWTLGIFIYEMLASCPPFYDDDQMQTYAKIMQGNITFPPHFTKDAISLIKKLLHHRPTKRLGVVKGGAKNIKKHIWYKAPFDWDLLFARKMKAPFVPNIKSDEDISNFDSFPGDGNVPEYVDDGTNWDDDF